MLLRYNNYMRKTILEDLKTIENIIMSAKISLREEGIDQWQIESMNRDFIEGQIKEEKSYVYEEGGRILAYAYLSDIKEEAYLPYEDDFIGENPITIHTFAVDKSVTKRGIALKFFIDIIKYAEKNGFDSLRIDTHEDNFKMRGLINKLEFKKLGEIFIDEEGVKKPRICYERVL